MPCLSVNAMKGRIIHLFLICSQDSWRTMEYKAPFCSAAKLLYSTAKYSSINHCM